jgi:hypothetical protein
MLTSHPNPAPTRLRVCDHAEPLAVARRLQRSEPATAADDRRALLLFWYGSGATRLRAEDDALLAAWGRHGGADHPLSAAIRAEHARLSHVVASTAADGRSSAETLRHIGDALAAHVLRQERELRGVVEHTVPPDELAELAKSLHLVRP